MVKTEKGENEDIETVGFYSGRKIYVSGILI